MTKSNENAEEHKQTRLSTGQEEDEKEERESPDLYSAVTVTENPFGESVWVHYEKVRQLDQGGTGELWLVRKKDEQQQQQRSEHVNGDDDNDDEINTQDYFVIKCIDKDFLFGIFTKELRNEFENLRTIDHPHVVRIYETFETRQEMFLVMEYADGGDLFARLPYTEAEVALILTQILSAVAYCHKQKIVHRDIKMENILFQTDKSPSTTNDEESSLHVKMIDFGYAQHYRRPRGQYTMQMDIGTTYTMSPQIVQGEYTEKCDIWSVGVVAYILLSGGNRPFDADENKDIRSQILDGKFSMDGRPWDQVSDQAKAFVKSLLEYEEDRRPTAQEAGQSPWLQRHSAKYLLLEEAPNNELMDTVQDALLFSTEESKLKRLSMMIVAHSAPEQKLHELRQVFDTLDQSNDGTINFKEFRDAMQDFDFVSEQLEGVFQELDQNNTGVINYTEFLSAVLESSTGYVEEDLVKEAFDKLDVNDVGTIDKDGLSTILGETNNAPLEEREEMAEEMLHEVCGANNGKVGYEEFSAMFNGGTDVTGEQPGIG